MERREGGRKRERERSLECEEGHREYTRVTLRLVTRCRRAREADLYIVNRQIVTTMLQKRVQSAAKEARRDWPDIELLGRARPYGTERLISQRESSFSVGECSHGRCARRRRRSDEFSFLYLSFLSRVRHEPPPSPSSPVVAPSLRTHERLDTPWNLRGATRRRAETAPTANDIRSIRATLPRHVVCNSTDLLHSTNVQGATHRVNYR